MQDSALNYYLESDFSNALRIYEDLYSQNYSSGDLFYNLGNCYYNTGDIANAVYFFEKAIILNPTDKDIQHNLKIAKAAVKSKTEALPDVFYKRWLTSILGVFSSDNWAILASILFAMALAGTGLYFFSKKIIIRKTGFISGIVCLIFSLIFLFFANNRANKITNGNYAIIFETSLVKSSPSDDSNNLFEISEGLKVEITDTLKTWSNIRLTDGKEGWVESANLKRI
jgi:tetratricopeptide (TPR) repeat protein